MLVRFSNQLIFSLAVVLLVLISSHAEDFEIIAQASPDWSSQFENTNGWIGSDAAYSIPLSDSKTLWLFGDTWIGEVRDGKRLHPKMINNSIALQSRNARPKFFYPTNSLGEAESFVKPKVGGGYFWPFHGVRTSGGLFIFLHQVKNIKSKTGKSDSPFDFKVFDEWMGVIDNPDDEMAHWRIIQKKFPFATFSEKETVTFGAAVLRDKGFVYIYGNSSSKEKKTSHMILARAAENDFADFSRWRFFSNGKWQKNFHESTAIWTEEVSEASVSFLPAIKKFVAVHSQGLSGKIVLRTADSPAGPWSEPLFVYQCPEMKISNKIFCYAGKAHPELSIQSNELIVTYAANSYSFWDVLNDARLYWPRFIRVELKVPSPL